MCDYSLMNLPNRLATEGEELLVYRFPTGSLGLASPGDLNPTSRDTSREPRSFWERLKGCFSSADSCAIPAVCVPPGARLRLENTAERLRRQYGLQAQEEATFEQLTAEPNVYRDAIVFLNGAKISLQEFPPGQRVTILALASPAAAAPTLVSTEPLQAEPAPPVDVCGA